MNIHFFTGFSKRVNSTKRPTGTATTTLAGKLRNDCSMLNPVIECKLSGETAPLYTYAYIPDFARYYFVSDWVRSEGLWVCHLSEDLLGTWKPYIGTSQAYIDRAASDYDGNIIDTLYPTKINSDIWHDTLNFSFYNPSTSGCFVLGIIDSNNDTEGQLGGAVTYYVMTPAQMKTFMNYIQSDTFLTDIGFPSVQTITSQMDQTLARAFVKPIDYIVSCIWFPYPYTSLQTQGTKQIKVGYWAISTTIASGYLLHHGAITDTIHVNLRNHPDLIRGNYVNFAPYTRIDVNIQPFGNIPIDTSFRANGNYMHLEVKIDSINGKAILRITINNSANTVGNEYVAEASGILGVPIQLAQVQGDYLTALTEGAQAAGNVLSLLTGDTVGHVANAIGALSPQVRSTGTDGSKLFTIIPPVIRYQFMPLMEEDNTELGRPLRDIRVINTLSGYVKCFEVTVDYPCFDSEKEDIHNMLLSGFFYE